MKLLRTRARSSFILYISGERSHSADCCRIKNRRFWFIRQRSAFWWSLMTATMDGRKGGHSDGETCVIRTRGSEARENECACFRASAWRGARGRRPPRVAFVWHPVCLPEERAKQLWSRYTIEGVKYCIIDLPFTRELTSFNCTSYSAGDRDNVDGSDKCRKHVTMWQIPRAAVVKSPRDVSRVRAKFAMQCDVMLYESPWQRLVILAFEHTRNLQ